MNYLASIAWASLGLVILLAYPFNGALLSPIVLATALPYFVAMAGDLKRCGYKRHGRVPHLRLQPDPARGQRVRRREVARAGDRRPEDRVRADAEGAQPHDGRDLVRARALRDHRVRALHDLARRAPGGVHARGLRGGERAALRLRRRRVHRHPPLARRRVVERRPARLAAGGAGRARAGARSSTGSPCCTTAPRPAAASLCRAPRRCARPSRACTPTASRRQVRWVRDGRLDEDPQAPPQALAAAAGADPRRRGRDGRCRRQGDPARHRRDAARDRGAVVRAVRRRDADPAVPVREPHRQPVQRRRARLRRRQQERRVHADLGDVLRPPRRRYRARPRPAHQPAAAARRRPDRLVRRRRQRRAGPPLHRRRPLRRVLAGDRALRAHDGRLRHRGCRARRHGRERAARACRQAAAGRGPRGEVEPRRLAHAAGRAAGHARRGARRDRGDAARERRPRRREPDDDGLRLEPSRPTATWSTRRATRSVRASGSSTRCTGGRASRSAGGTCGASSG